MMFYFNKVINTVYFVNVILSSCQHGSNMPDDFLKYLVPQYCRAEMLKLTQMRQMRASKAVYIYLFCLLNFYLEPPVVKHHSHNRQSKGQLLTSVIKLLHIDPSGFMSRKIKTSERVRGSG